MRGDRRHRSGPSFMGGTLSAAETRLVLRLFLQPGRCAPGFRFPGSGLMVQAANQSAPCTLSPDPSSLAPNADSFEAAFAAAVNTPHAVAFVTGRVALWAILRAMGIGGADEVVV